MTSNKNSAGLDQLASTLFLKDNKNQNRVKENKPSPCKPVLDGHSPNSSVDSAHKQVLT